MKKYVIMAVAFFVAMSIFLFVFADNSVETATVEAQNLPTLEQSTVTPVIADNPTDTPVLNDPAKEQNWFTESNANIQSLVNRIDTEKRILEKTYDPNAKAKYVMDLADTRNRCIELVNIHNENSEGTPNSTVPATVCD